MNNGQHRHRTMMNSDRYCPACQSELDGIGLVVSSTGRATPSHPRRKSGPGWVAATLGAVMIALVVFAWQSIEPRLWSSVAPSTDKVPLLINDRPALKYWLDRATSTSLVALTADHLEIRDLDSTANLLIPLPDHAAPTEGFNTGTPLLFAGDGIAVAVGGNVRWVDVGEWMFTDIGPGYRLAPSSIADRVWILEPQVRGGAETWREVDAEGNTTRWVQQPAGTRPWDHGLGTPELTWQPGGGILALDQDAGWLYVVDGAPVAANSTSAIVQRCTGVSCAHSWVDPWTGASIARELPPTLNEPGPRAYRLSPSGSTVLEVNPPTDFTTPVYAYHDGGARITGCGAGWKSATWSISGDLLACVDVASVSVTDLPGGQIVIFDDWSRPPLAVALIPTSWIDVAALPPPNGVRGA